MSLSFMLVRLIFLLLCFAAIFGSTNFVPPQTFISASATPTVAPTPTFAEQSENVIERWRAYQVQVKYQKYNRALYEFITAHTPSNLKLDERGIELDANENIWARAIVVPAMHANELPLVIVSNPSLYVSIHETLLFTWRSEHWEWQSLPYVDLEQVKRAYYIPNARMAELFVAFQDCASCSATAIRFDVWRYREKEWQRVWQMPFQGEAKSHGELAFDDAMFQTIRLRYSLWNQPAPKNFFYESNPGPHRYITETWQREGDGYKLIGAEIENSAYNTLVEFSYAMNQEDWAAAKRWAVNDAVIDQARALGYKDIGGLTYPPKHSCSLFVIEQCDTWEINLDRASAPKFNFTVHLIKRGAQWFVSNIERRRK